MKRNLLLLFVIGILALSSTSLLAQPAIVGTITGHSEGDNFSATETISYSFEATGLTESTSYKYIVSQDGAQDWYDASANAWISQTKSWYKTYDQYRNISTGIGETTHSESSSINLSDSWTSTATATSGDIRKIKNGAGYINFVVKLNSDNSDVAVHKFAINIVSSPNAVSDVKAFESKVYPNPATDILNIEAPEGSSVAIYNAAGSIVKFSTSIAPIAIDDLAAGVYFVKIDFEGKSVVEKIQVK